MDYAVNRLGATASTDRLMRGLAFWEQLDENLRHLPCSGGFILWLPGDRAILEPAAELRNHAQGRTNLAIDEPLRPPG